MFTIGVDWSGTPALPDETSQGPLLVITAVCVESGKRTEVSSRLASVRRTFKLPASYVFKYSSCRTALRLAFLTEMRSLPVTVYVRVIDKRLWNGSYLIQQRTGFSREVDAIVSLLRSCPASILSGSTVLIDAPKSEMKLIQAIRKSLSLQLMYQDHQGPQRIKPIPDTHPDGELVQVADMYAGFVRTHSDPFSLDGIGPIRLI